MDWAERYRQGDTPWEKGEAHPELPFLLEEHREFLEKARSILVPGCGMGHDARMIANAFQGKVTGLDLADEAIRQAVEFSPGDSTDWAVGDLFEWQGNFDLVFEHTCFCAIPVERRPDYVDAMARLIPAGGHLLGVFFLNPDHDGEEGPPFGVRRDELKNYFMADFEFRWTNPPSRTYPGRTGEDRELCVLMERKA